jgi:acetyl esterase/lipase
MNPLHPPSSRIRRLFLAAATVCVFPFFLNAGKPDDIPLWPEGVPGLLANAGPERIKPTTASHIHHPVLMPRPAPADKAVGTAVIICPGGGYGRLAMEQTESVAAWFNSIGVSAFVLRYRLSQYGQPAPLRDVLRAIRMLRAHATDHHIAPDRIGVIGFSAGGHLASCAATLYDDPDGKTGAPLDETSARPDFAILMYPVISMRDPIAHHNSRKSLLGESPPAELIAKYSTDKQVTKNTPPALLIAATDDKVVLVENSIRFYQALNRAGVPASLVIYHEGRHGFGMQQDRGTASAWPRCCEDWLRANGWLRKNPE